MSHKLPTSAFPSLSPLKDVLASCLLVVLWPLPCPALDLWAPEACSSQRPVGVCSWPSLSTGPGSGATHSLGGRALDTWPGAPELGNQLLEPEPASGLRAKWTFFCGEKPWHLLAVCAPGRPPALIFIRDPARGIGPPCHYWLLPWVWLRASLYSCAVCALHTPRWGCSHYSLQSAKRKKNKGLNGQKQQPCSIAAIKPCDPWPWLVH